MFIITDKNTNQIIETLQTKNIVDEKWIESSHGSLIQLDIVDVVEVESVPLNTNYYKDGKFSERHPEEVAKDAETLQKQIDAIDKKIVRDAEDIYDLLVAKGLILEGEEPELPFVKQRKEQKKVLRLQLKSLQEE